MAVAFRSAAMVCLWLVASARGQTRPAPIDPAPLILQLEHADTHPRAVKTINGLPEGAVVSLLEAADAATTPAKVREEIYGLLGPVFARLQAARAADNDAVNDAWVRTSLVEAYQQVGRTDAKWDRAAIEGLGARRGEKRFEALRTAVDAGCSDPVVRLEYLSDGLANGKVGVPQMAKNFLAAYRDLQVVQYPAATKGMVRGRLALRMGSIAWPADFAPNVKYADVFDSALDLLPAYVASKPDPREVRTLCQGLYEGALKRSGERKAAYERVIRILEGLLSESAWVDNLAGHHFHEWAWEARGGGYGFTVTEQGGKLFEERLKLSGERVLKAWREDPLDGDSAVLLMDNCLGGGGDRAALESWFRRALLADPESVEAWKTRAFYYSPQWYGSPEQALAIGREAVAKGTGRNRLPTVLLEVIANFDLISEKDGEVYHQAETWKDVRSVFEKLLADKTRLKDDKAMYLVDRSDYLLEALHAHQWKAFLDLAKEFGNDIDMRRVGGKDRFDYQRRRAEEMLAHPPVAPAA